MSDTPKIIVLSGSTRTGSTNTRLAHALARLLEQAGGKATVVDLKDYDMPLYNGDLQASGGLPEAARKLKQLFRAHDGFIITSPEYNGSVSPLLKNVIDWVSRPESADEPMVAAFMEKVAGIAAASPGGLGGLRGLAHVRDILSGMGVHVVPAQLAVGGALEAFDETGGLKAPMHQNLAKSLVNQVVKVARQLQV